MNVVRPPSRTSQVVELLRREILTGKLAPGDRIEGVRPLASRLGVGTQVIHSAFEALEREGLVIRSPRKGVHVSGKVATRRSRTVFFLAYGVDTGNRYLQQMLRMTCPPHLPDNVNFLTRIVPRAQSSPEAFAFELTRIAGMPWLDAVVVLGSTLDRNEIEACRRLPSPVIFLGGFQKGLFKDLDISRVTDDNAHIATVCIEHLVGRQCRRVLLLSGSLKYAYQAAFAGAAAQAADRLGAHLQVVDTPPGIHASTQAEQDKVVGRLLKPAFLRKFDALLIAGVGFAMVERHLAAAGIGPDDLALLTTEEELMNVPCLRMDYSPLYQEVYRIIDRLRQDPTPVGVRKLSMEIGIVHNELLNDKASVA
jgi:hypothetical protein